MRQFSLLIFCLLPVLFCEAQMVQVLPYEPGEGLTIEAGNQYRLELSGMIQPMSETRIYPETDGRKSYTRFRMRRMITKLRGSAAQEKIRYQLQVDLTGSSDGGADAGNNNYLMDAWISWRPSRGTEITFGQENSPTDSRELGILSSGLQMAERSVVSTAFSSIREFGVFAKTQWEVGHQSRVVPYLALTNGDGANVSNPDHGGLKVGGRLDFLPFGTFVNGGQYCQHDLDREQTPKLVVGAHYSYNSGISDRRGRQSGTILYLDSAGKETLPDYRKFGVDFLFKYRGFSASGEYINANASVPKNTAFRVRNDGSTSSSFLVNNIQDVDGYVKGRIIVGSGVNFQAGYLFRSGFSVDGRFTKLMPQAQSFLRNGTFYNRSAYYTLCFSQYLARNYGAKVQAAFSYARAEAGSVTVGGQAQKGNEMSAILMLTLAL